MSTAVVLPNHFARFLASLFFLIFCKFTVIGNQFPSLNFCAKFQISCEVNSFSYDLSYLYGCWQAAKISSHFYQYCDELSEHRIHVRQNLLVSLKKITTWNISGWRPPSYGCNLKMSVVRRYLKRGPVCLQETCWSTSMTVGTQQRFNAVQICSLEAVPTLNGGLSGGVAVLVPTSLQVLATAIIVPGRALAVKVSSRTAKFWIFSIYLYPLSKKRESQNMILNGNVPEAPCVVSEDFNHVDSEHPDAWNSFLPLLGVKSTLQGKTTFVGPKGESSINDVLISTKYTQNSLLWPKAYLKHNYQHSGHTTISIKFRHRPSVSSTESFASHATIPSNVY